MRRLRRPYRRGHPAPHVRRVRADSLSQIAAGEFGEYFEPFTGQQLGSTQQSWTAAVTLDWLAADPGAERPDLGLAG